MNLLKAIGQARSVLRQDKKAGNYWVGDLQVVALEELMKAVSEARPDLRYIGLSTQQLVRMPCADPGGGGCMGGRCPPCTAKAKRRPKPERT